jgi:uncharacterized protein YciI
MKKLVALLTWSCAFCLYGCLVSPMAAQENPKSAAKTFLVIYRPGPSWLPGKSVSEQPLKEHGQYMLSLYAKGSVKIAGQFTDDAGGAMALEVRDEAEARAIVAADPGVKSGVFIPEVHPWALAQWDKLIKK